MYATNVILPEFDKVEYWSFNFTTFVRNRLKFNLQLNLLVFFVCRAPCQVSSQCNIDIHVFVFVIVTLHILANETRSDAEVVILNTARAILVSELWQSKGLCDSTLTLNLVNATAQQYKFASSCLFGEKEVVVLVLVVEFVQIQACICILIANQIN